MALGIAIYLFSLVSAENKPPASDIPQRLGNLTCLSRSSRHLPEIKSLAQAHLLLLDSIERTNA